MKKPGTHPKTGEQKARRPIPKNDFIQVLQPTPQALTLARPNTG